MSKVADTDRPERPDTSLLEVAGTSLQELLKLDDPPRWTVLRRDVRTRSTLFRLVARHQAGKTYVWGKSTPLPR